MIVAFKTFGFGATRLQQKFVLDRKLRDGFFTHRFYYCLQLLFIHCF